MTGSDRWRLAAGGAGLVIAVALVGLVLYHGFAEPEDVLADGDPPRVVDGFDRIDSADELGDADGGRWQAVAGTWGVQAGRAVLVRPAPGRPVHLAVVDPGTANVTVSATATGMAPGWALVFRYRGPSDHWLLVAAPGFGTWNVVAVEGGQRRQVANLGLAPTAAGTRATVQLRGDQVKVFLAGRFHRALTAPADAGATGVGIAALGPAPGASWDDFAADAAGPVVTPAPPPSSGPPPPPSPSTTVAP